MVSMLQRQYESSSLHSYTRQKFGANAGPAYAGYMSGQMPRAAQHKRELATVSLGARSSSIKYDQAATEEQKGINLCMRIRSERIPTGYRTPDLVRVKDTSYH